MEKICNESTKRLQMLRHIWQASWNLSFLHFKFGLTQTQHFFFESKIWSDTNPTFFGSKIWSDTNPKFLGSKIWSDTNPRFLGSKIWSDTKPTFPGSKIWLNRNIKFLGSDIRPSKILKFLECYRQSCQLFRMHKNVSQRWLQYILFLNIRAKSNNWN